jgi:hypothetical protein
MAGMAKSSRVFVQTKKSIRPALTLQFDLEMFLNEHSAKSPHVGTAMGNRLREFGANGKPQAWTKQKILLQPQNKAKNF